jgi:hypothetical protein
VPGQWGLRRCGEGLGWREVQKEIGIFGSLGGARNHESHESTRMSSRTGGGWGTGRQEKWTGLVGRGALEGGQKDRALGGDFRGGPEWR